MRPVLKSCTSIMIVNLDNFFSTLKFYSITFAVRFRRTPISMPFQVIEDGTVRRRSLIISDGYGYLKNTEGKDGKKVYWRCRVWKNGCKARAILDVKLNKFFLTAGHSCDINTSVATISKE